MKNQHLTTSQGSPVGDNQNSLTAGEFGPVLIQDVHLLEKLAHFNRERVPTGCSCQRCWCSWNFQGEPINGTIY